MRSLGGSTLVIGDLNASALLDLDEDGVMDRTRLHDLFEPGEARIPFDHKDNYGFLIRPFISPLAENVPLNRFTMRDKEDLELMPGESPEVVGLTVLGGGVHQVELDPAPAPGEWLKVTLRVRGVSSGREMEMALCVAHHPGDVNGDGTVDVRDATAFGDEFSGERRQLLIDSNGDGVVDIRDATTYGQIWNGDGGHRAWQGSTLPPKPE